MTQAAAKQKVNVAGHLKLTSHLNSNMYREVLQAQWNRGEVVSSIQMPSK